MGGRAHGRTRARRLVALVVVTAACAVGQPVAAGTADPPVPEPPVDARAAARPPAPVEFESAGGLPRGDDRVSAQATTSTRLVAPTRSCVPELSGPESYQRAFDQRDGVWAGADGAVPVRLDGNRILWLFSDTIIGRVGWDGRRFPDWTLVHSSFVLQEGRCFTPLLRGRPGAWEDAIPRPQPNHYWWPVAGVFDPAQRKVHIFARRLEDYAPGEYRPPNAFKLVGFEIVHYALDGLRYLGREPLPSGFANRSGDVPYGAGVMPGRDGVYLYGCNTEIFVGDRGCYVARAARDLRPDSWRYWAPTGTGGGWSPNPADAMPMLLPDVPIGQLAVIPYGTGYLASGQDGLLVRAARAWYSDSPVGPWFPLGTAGDENASPHGPVPAHWRTYGGRILDLPGAGLVTAFNVNTGDDANFLLGWAYGARFAASLATGPGRGVEVSPTRGWYTLDGFGHVVPRGGAPHFGNPQFTGWDIARDLAVMPDGRGYVVLDGWGGLHRFGSARTLPAVPARTYWPGWDIARAVAITPDGRGYVVLDGFGGLHAVGTARVPAGAPYWSGWDIARGLALTADGRGLYVLDGFGGVHAVGAPRRGSPRFGWDIARGITATARGYTVLDGLGGLHRFGDAPPPATPSRAPAEYGAVTLRPDGRYVVQRRPGGADAVW